MYVRSESLANSLTSLAHHFLKVNNKPYKLQPGGPGYELVWGTTGVLPYLESLAPTGDLDESFALIAQHEQNLVAPLLQYLTSPQARARGVLVVGREEVDVLRVPTISFVVRGEHPKTSKSIVEYFDKKGNVRS